LDRSSDEFILLLTRAQPVIYACIFALHPDSVAAQDLLQETNLTLCRKANEFEPGTNFHAWATRIARYHVLNFRRQLKRDQVVFDASLIEELCARHEQRSEELSDSMETLRDCIKSLPDSQRKLLQERYVAGGSVSGLAKRNGKSVAAVSQSLYRLRQSLMDCVYRKMQESRI
jgi:RNA polymerase sigma-70 factor, ECF subfamily